MGLYDIGQEKNLIGAYSTGDVALGDTSDTQTLRLYGSNLSTNGYVCLSGGVASTASSCTSSDARLKNIKSAISRELALAEIGELKPVVYTWKDPKQGAGDQIGLVAQDVEKRSSPAWSEADRMASRPWTMQGLWPRLLPRSRNQNLRMRLSKTARSIFSAVCLEFAKARKCFCGGVSGRFLSRKHVGCDTSIRTKNQRVKRSRAFTLRTV